MTDRTPIMSFKKIIQSLTYVFRLKADTDICDSKQNEYSRQYLCSQGKTQTDCVWDWSAEGNIRFKERQ